VTHLHDVMTRRKSAAVRFPNLDGIAPDGLDFLSPNCRSVDPARHALRLKERIKSGLQ